MTLTEGKVFYTDMPHSELKLTSTSKSHWNDYFKYKLSF